MLQVRMETWLMLQVRMETRLMLQVRMETRLMLQVRMETRLQRTSTSGENGDKADAPGENGDTVERERKKRLHENVLGCFTCRGFLFFLSLMFWMFQTGCQVVYYTIRRFSNCSFIGHCVELFQAVHQVVWYSRGRRSRAVCIRPHSLPHLGREDWQLAKSHSAEQVRTVRLKMWRGYVFLLALERGRKLHTTVGHLTESLRFSCNKRSEAKWWNWNSWLPFLGKQ